MRSHVPGPQAAVWDHAQVPPPEQAQTDTGLWTGAHSPRRDRRQSGDSHPIVKSFPNMDTGSEASTGSSPNSGKPARHEPPFSPVRKIVVFPPHRHHRGLPFRPRKPTDSGPKVRVDLGGALQQRQFRAVIGTQPCPGEGVGGDRDPAQGKPGGRLLAGQSLPGVLELLPHRDRRQPAPARPPHPPETPAPNFQQGLAAPSFSARRPPESPETLAP